MEPSFINQYTCCDETPTETADALCMHYRKPWNVKKWSDYKAWRESQGDPYKLIEYHLKVFRWSKEREADWIVPDLRNVESSSCNGDCCENFGGPGTSKELNLLMEPGYPFNKGVIHQCQWFDKESRRCKHYAQRPLVCETHGRDNACGQCGKLFSVER